MSHVKELSLAPGRFAPANMVVASKVIHSYRRYGHVLCRQGAVREALATKAAELVTCPHCQRLLSMMFLAG